MNKKLFIGFIIVLFSFASCKSGVNNEEPAKEGRVVSSVMGNAEIPADSVTVAVSVDSIHPTDTLEKVAYEKIIADTVIGGVRFKRYSFVIRTKDLADDVSLTLPMGDDVVADKKIISSLVDDFSLDADSLQQQLVSRFEAYADGSYAEDGDEYHESELIVFPVNVIGKKYVAYMLHSSLFWPSEQNHPQWADVYYMFDLNTGEIITIDDIYAASQEIRQTVGVKIHEELVKLAGNEEDIFAEAGSELLNASFVFDDKGMTFFYQPYEVGPYMLGEPEVFLSKEWLEPYLKVDGVLYKYWFDK